MGFLHRRQAHTQFGDPGVLAGEGHLFAGPKLFHQGQCFFELGDAIFTCEPHRFKFRFAVADGHAERQPAV
jgi:hypothetical protein